MGKGELIKKLYSKIKKKKEEKKKKANG